MSRTYGSSLITITQQTEFQSLVKSRPKASTQRFLNFAKWVLLKMFLRENNQPLRTHWTNLTN